MCDSVSRRGIRLADFSVGADIPIEMSEPDLELLRRYAEESAEDAFGRLVERHLGLVHSAALRVVRSEHLAEEVAQSVFVDLAQNAKRLSSRTVLVAWLYEVTRRTSVDVVRRETRRAAREEVAEELKQMNSTEGSWKEIEPLLEEAMASLEPSDRTAVLLRYFQNKSLSEVGAVLGASENAAQKRVSRALQRLHDFFRRKGVASSVNGVALLLSANAVQAAPPQLAAGIVTGALQTGAAAGLSTVAAGTINTIFMSTTQKVILGTLMVAAVGTALHQGYKASELRQRVLTLEATRQSDEGSTSLAASYDGLQREIAQLRAENDAAKSNASELLKLRAEVTRLKGEAKASAALTTAAPAIQAEAVNWLARVNLLKEHLARTPHANVPELRLLGEQDWLNAAQGPKLESEEDFRRAMSSLRTQAQYKVANLLQPALAKYLEQNGKKFPESLAQLQGYLESPVDNDILQRFSVIPAKAVNSVQMGGDWAISQTEPVDREFDSRVVIGPHGFGSTSWKSENTDVAADVNILREALRAFETAHGGRAPSDPAELAPFLKTDSERNAFERLRSNQQQ